MQVRLGAWREKWLIGSLCALAAIRVFTFSAAFPPVNHVDEHGHFDLIGKFGRGYWPSQRVEPYDASSARLFVIYGSYEYLRAPATLPPGMRDPLWKRAPHTVERVLARQVPTWTARTNHEAQAPPVYYAVAALWHRVGGWLGFGEVKQFYWTRFLNAPLYALLVLLAYVYCRMGCSDRLEIRLGVPLLVAFFPLDVFYGLNSDVLSPVLYTATLVGFLKWQGDDSPSLLLSGLLGLGVALALLTKLTNVGLVLICGGVLVLKVLRDRRAGVETARSSTGMVVLAAALPVALWGARNLAHFGDWTGSGPKVEALGWSLRPFSALFDHPLFSPVELWRYLQHLTAVLWRGEYHWHGEVMLIGGFNSFYGLSSLLLPLAAAVGYLMTRRESRSTPGAVSFSALNWAAVVLGVACLCVLSVMFDFGRSHAPSRQYPFFASGRLIVGMLVPFAAIYIEGIAVLLRPLKSRLGPLIAVAVLALAITIGEIVLTLPVFSSPFNWFHLP